MEKHTGTIFKVFLLQKGDPTKQEGFLELWKHRGQLQRVHNVPFDYLDELPGKIRKLLRKATNK